MKILDVGCHDGFVGMWLRQEWEAKHPDEELIIDGVELHPHGVAEARRRGYRHAIHGSAEELPMIFEEHSYDAVIAYELIEHVPDMDAFLAALERMLTATGHIYVSTPDGCFGDGNNPHHLRALRSIDVAELLRRRGDLVSMGVGDDTITVASYKPRERRGTVAIHTGGAWQRWSPLDIDSRGLGGSETAAVRLADALDEEGWVVTVYGDVEQGVHKNVVYRHVETFDPLEHRDILIGSRLPELFDRPINAGRKMLWLHDTDCGDRLTPERAEQLDDVLVLSGWHQMHVISRYPFLDGKLRIIRNGVDLDRFTSADDNPVRKRRLLYTSSPDRGLDILLELWPHIRRRCPGATFEFAYAPVYQAIAGQDPTVGKHHARIQELAAQKGVTGHLDGLSQPALARLMLESRVWCAPSYNTPHDTPFYETSCIGAMEAQAAGLHVVASAWGALTETVTAGVLVDEEPNSDAWRAALVDEIVRGLTDPAAAAAAEELGPLAAGELGWDGVAEDITGLATGDLALVG